MTYYTRGSTSAGNAIVYQKRTITQVRKTIKEDGQWTGFIVGNHVNPFHFFGGWRLAYEVVFQSLQELEDNVADMLYYMDTELGNRVAFYEEVKGRE